MRIHYLTISTKFFEISAKFFEISRIQNILPLNKRKNMLIVQDIWLKLSRALQGDAKAMNSALDKIEKFTANFNRNS